MSAARGRDPVAGLAEARWALHSRPARRRMRAGIGPMLGDGWRLGPCRLRRAKLKPGRKLSAYYQVDVSTPGTETSVRRAIAITWEPSEGSIESAERREGVAIQAGAVPSHLAAPFAELRAEDPGWGMRILVSPLDETFPQLVRLSDPDHAASMIPGPISGRPRLQTVRYRPGQRHVLRFDFGEKLGARRTVFAKLYRDDHYRTGLSAAEAAAGWLDSEESVAAARPLPELPEDNTSLWEGLDGGPVSSPGARLRGSWTNHIFKAGRLLRALHRDPGELCADLGPRHLADELRATAGACEHIDALLPGVGSEITRLLERGRELYECMPQEEPTFAHGDFKLDHLWADRERLTVLDFDSSCRADPALDVGKLLADLYWWCGSEPPRLVAARRAFQEGYGARSVPERLERARVWEAVWSIKLAARRVPFYISGWEPRTAELVGRARSLLSSLG